MKRRSRYRRILLWTALGLAGLALVSAVPSAVATAGRVEHNFAENDGLRLHYVARGEGPLLVLIHGIPEFWYSWKAQIGPLSENYRVVAVDQRGFNRSDAPVNQEGYRAEHLVEDVAAVIRAEGHEQATIIGHDSGAFVAWYFAATHPDMTERLVALSVPHPNAFVEELANNPAQHVAGGYARQMQQPGATAAFRVGPIGVLRDPLGWPLHLAADLRTDHDAIVAFYQANYPREPYAVDPTLGEIDVPTLVIHGEADQFLLASGHARNEKWLGQLPETLMFDAGHFVHQEAAEAVNAALLEWLSETEQAQIGTK